MIKFDALGFSECSSEEVTGFIWRSVYVIAYQLFLVLFLLTH